MACNEFRQYRLILQDGTAPYFKDKAEAHKNSTKAQTLKELVDGDPVADIWHELAEAAYSVLVDAVYRSLKACLDGMTFAWEEIDDRWIEEAKPYILSKDGRSKTAKKSIYADDLAEDVMLEVSRMRDSAIYYHNGGIYSAATEADLVKSRIKLYEEHFHKMKFLRIFSNH